MRSSASRAHQGRATPAGLDCLRSERRLSGTLPVKTHVQLFRFQLRELTRACKPKRPSHCSRHFKIRATVSLLAVLPKLVLAKALLSCVQMLRAPHLQDLVGRAAHACPPGDGAGLDPLQLPQQRLVAGGRRWRAVCQAAALRPVNVWECDFRILTTDPEQCASQASS